MDFLKIVKEYEQDMVKDLMELMSIKSLLDPQTAKHGAPFGQPVREALDWMLTKGQDEGFEVTDLDGYAGILSFGDQSDSIGVLGHLDVVPAQGEWFQDPFTPFIKDGYIVGRGSGDDKGPTIAAYYAMKILKDLKYEFNHRIDLILGCDEETGMRCMDYYKEVTEVLPVKGIVPDAYFPVIYAEKGIVQFDLVFDNKSPIDSMQGGTRPNIVIDSATATLNQDIDAEEFKHYLLSQGLKGDASDKSLTVLGTAYHASLPHYGVNAGMHLLSFIAGATQNEQLLLIVNTLRNTFGHGLRISNESPSMGPLTMNLGVVQIDSETIRLTMDIRYPRESNVDEILEKFKSLLGEVKIENLHNSAPLYNDPRSKLVMACMNAYQKITGDTDSVARTMGGGTYARTLPNHVAFGAEFPTEVKPEWVGGPHEINEAMSVDALVKACAIYCEALVQLAQEKK